MLNTGIRKRSRTTIVRPPGALAAARAALGWRYTGAISAALLVGALILLRINWTPTPDGDPALHLRLIKDIAATRSLPANLPFHPARIGEGGALEAMFPYSYPPLYHVTAAIVYSAAGLRGALMINVIAAAVIAFCVHRFVSRGAPGYVALLAAPATFVSPFVQVPFASTYMEPMMLAFLFAGAWLAYLAMAFRQTSFAIAAGLLLGLSIATRQNAVMPVLVLGLLMLWHLAERRAWRMPRRSTELPWFSAIIAAAALAAAPSLLYLLQVTGTLGYADLTLPGMSTTLPVDPVANEYIASISKPELPAAGWLARYQEILLYSNRWIAKPFALVPLALFVFGAMHMNARGGAARFFARWALLQVVAEALLFVTLHGNARYVVASQMLLYAIVPVGGYAVIRHAAHWGRSRGNVRYATYAGTVALCALTLYALLPVGFLRDSYLQSRDRDLRAFRGDEYAEMGAWVSANTRPDALFLTPRTYTAVLTWDRNVTWVTFYGNAWVVDAITTPDPAEANEILRRYGVDYVLVMDPPGTYIDRVPATGMRSYLTLGREDSAYFSLAHLTESEGEYGDVRHGLRLYRVETPQ